MIEILLMLRMPVTNSRSLPFVSFSLHSAAMLVVGSIRVCIIVVALSEVYPISMC